MPVLILLLVTAAYILIARKMAADRHRALRHYYGGKRGKAAPVNAEHQDHNHRPEVRR